MEDNPLFRCPCCDDFALKLTLVVAHLGAVHSAEPVLHVKCDIGDCSEVYIKVTSYRTYPYRVHRDVWLPANVPNVVSTGHEHDTVFS